MQIEACHRRGIRVPIYVTVQWDDFSANAHPEWLCIDEKGGPHGTPPLEPGFYRFLDVSHPGYRAFLRDHVGEILRTLPVDGLFFDIVQPRPSLSRRWLDAMDNAGLDPESPADRHRFATRVVNEWKVEMTQFIRGLNRDCTVFYNTGTSGPRTGRPWTHTATTNWSRCPRGVGATCTSRWPCGTRGGSRPAAGRVWV